MDLGLLQAIGTLYPCAEHRFCLRHIHKNMNKMWNGMVFQDMLWNCASTTMQEFNHAMEELRKLNNDSYELVKGIPPQHWSRAQFIGLFYFYLKLRIGSVQKVIDKVVGPLTPTTASVLVKKNKSDAAQCVGKFCGNGKLLGEWSTDGPMFCRHGSSHMFL
uniref:MULE transposase domain-containing protein n=1 Tax=Lactuca sativa TaxID=4236 RepID=A0A9R1VNN9_LACSA|nr:hypothetical protein LSAT_V11C500264140 [Lactuca sativa]